MAIKLGTNNNETLTGTAGWDTLYALAGNDMLSGGTGRDILSGGDGNDTLEGGAGADYLHGGAGADVFKYSNFTHAIKDKIVDFSAEDTLDFSAIANAKFIGNAQFNGVAGEIRYYNSKGFFDNPGDTYLSIDTDGDAEENLSLLVSSGSFSFTETASNSKTLTLAANQTINGTAAAESLVGSAGNNIIDGLAGNDSLAGGEGNDVLQGGDGNDLLVGGPGKDSLIGGAGADTFRFNSPDDFSQSDPSGIINDSSVSDWYLGDTIKDFSGNDKIVFSFQGIKFINNARFSGTPGEYRQDYYDGTIQFDFDGDKNTDTYINLQGNYYSQVVFEEKVVGSNKLTIVLSQYLAGSEAGDTIIGGNGYDRINGNAGNDSLVGGGANDILDGGSGNDVLVGGLGADSLTGGSGNDVFKFNSTDETSYTKGYDTIIDFATGDKINLSSIDANALLAGNQAFLPMIITNFTGIAGELRYDGYGVRGDVDGDMNADFYIGLTGSPSLTTADFVL